MSLDACDEARQFVKEATAKAEELGCADESKPLSLSNATAYAFAAVLVLAATSSFVCMPTDPMQIVQKVVSSATFAILGAIITIGASILAVRCIGGRSIEQDATKGKLAAVLCIGLVFLALALVVGRAFSF